MKATDPAPTPFDGSEQLIFIDPKKDVYTAKVVIGPAPAEFYKEKMLRELVAQILKNIPPTPHEKNGYEMFTYSLIIKPYKEQS